MSSLGQGIPPARVSNLISADLPDGIMVYDSARHRASHLNRTATVVWQHCDGKKSIGEFVELLRQADLPADESIVWLALDRLEKAHLMDGPLDRPAGEISRRAVIRKLALAGALTALIPMVTAIVAPTPAMATRSKPAGGGI